jgi:hypothetical protein
MLRILGMSGLLQPPKKFHKNQVSPRDYDVIFFGERVACGKKTPSFWADNFGDGFF